MQLQIAQNIADCRDNVVSDVFAGSEKGLLPSSPPPTHQIMRLRFMNQRLLPPTTITGAIIVADYLYIAVPRAVNGQTIGPRTTRGLRPLETDIAAILPISRGSIRGIWL